MYYNLNRTSPKHVAAWHTKNIFYKMIYVEGLKKMVNIFYLILGNLFLHNFAVRPHFCGFI